MITAVPAGAATVAAETDGVDDVDIDVAVASENAAGAAATAVLLTTCSLYGCWRNTAG